MKVTNDPLDWLTPRLSAKPGLHVLAQFFGLELVEFDHQTGQVLMDAAPFAIRGDDDGELDRKTRQCGCLRPFIGYRPIDVDDHRYTCSCGALGIIDAELRTTESRLPRSSPTYQAASPPTTRAMDMSTT